MWKPLPVVSARESGGVGGVDVLTTNDLLGMYGDNLKSAQWRSRDEVMTPT